MIREATDADIDRIVEMSMHFLAFLKIEPDPQQLGQTIGLAFEHGVILLAERQLEVIGMLAVVILPHAFTGKPIADEVAWWVEPEHRNGREAYNLLRSAIDWSRQRGVSVLKMVAPAASPEVGAFYERVGFTLVESAYTIDLTKNGRGVWRSSAGFAGSSAP